MNRSRKSISPPALTLLPSKELHDPIETIDLLLRVFKIFQCGQNELPSLLIARSLAPNVELSYDDEDAGGRSADEFNHPTTTNLTLLPDRQNAMPCQDPLPARLPDDRQCHGDSANPASKFSLVN
ncbi:hypothetical protein R1flu_006009 [Riccia fluitans]|uniref:Uncharacterized protein n=1 Tax=Riccia fluitans TaxID=41844 RepID=A0ABD1YV21_9MARC